MIEISATITLRSKEGGGVEIVTDPPGLIPTGASPKDAFQCLGGALLTMLVDKELESALADRDAARRSSRHRVARPSPPASP